MIRDRRRTVNVAITFNMVVDVPADWDEGQIDFWLNESSHCLGNELDEIMRAAQRQEGCACGMAEGKYLGEATTEDEARFGWGKHEREKPEG